MDKKGIWAGLVLIFGAATGAWAWSSGWLSQPETSPVAVVEPRVANSGSATAGNSDTASSPPFREDAAMAEAAMSPLNPASENSTESGEVGGMPFDAPPEDTAAASEEAEDIQAALIHMRTVCTSNQSNPNPGDVVPGIWSNPKRSSTGWTFAFEGTRMRVLWHTFYPWVGGGMTWLTSDSGEVQRQGVQERIWTAGAYRPRYPKDLPYTPAPRVGRMTLAFPEDSATRAAVVWRWDSDNEVGRSLRSVECIYSFGNDSPAAKGPSLDETSTTTPPPPTETAARGPFYTGIWTDPSTPGFEAAVSMIAPYTELVTLNIYDQAGKPTWVSAQIPLLSSGASPPADWPSTEWLGQGYTSTNRTEVDLVYRTAKYDMSSNDCESLAGCVDEKRFQGPDNFFGRAYYGGANTDLNNAVMGLRITSLSPVAINWPPTDWLPPPAGSDLSGCPTESLRRQACRPVKRITDRENLTVSPLNCDLQNQSNGVCKVSIAWNASILGYVERLDADTQLLVPMIRNGESDNGIVGASAWGRVVDEFTSERRLLYRLRVGNRLITRGVRVGESTISATRCVIPSGSSTCETQVSWRTPDEDSTTSLIKIYRSVSTNGGPAVYVPNGPWQEYKSTGSKSDTIRSNEVVVYSVRRVGAATSTHLASTSYVIPVSAYVRATPNACSVPLNQTTCSTKVSWLAGSSDAKVFRKDLVGGAADQQVGAPGMEGVDVIDNLTAGSRVQYVVKVFGQPQGTSNDVSAIASRIWTNAPNCIVPFGQQTCAMKVNWNSVDGAQIYRLNETTQVLEPLKDDSGNDVIGFSGSVDDFLAPGASVHYEVRIGGVVHAVTPTTTASTDTEGGDAGDGGIVDLPPLPAPFAEPAEDVESDKVGAIVGEFRVDEAGGASYRIPLAAPPGAGGLAPALALVYNSNGTDGAFGTGFSLEGASAIVACRPGVESGDAVGPTANPTEFCLDGQRLLLVGGTHRQVGAEYRTEIESFHRIRLTAIENVGVTGHDSTGYVFTVQGKDGNVRTFGGASGTVSAMAATGSGGSTTLGGLEPAPVETARYTAQAWLQTQLKDAVGNVVAFQYSAQTAMGERYLERVSYAGGSVVFEYQDSGRPDVAYSVLGPRRQSKLVKGIEVRASSGTTLRYYEPTYNTAVSDPYVPAWARSRPVLFSLKECSARNGVCYPATRFSWNFASAYTESIEGNLPTDPGGYYKVGDFNGDKRADIWWTTMSNGQPNQSLRISTFTSTTTNGQPTLRTIDPGHLFPNGYLNGGLWEVLDGDGDGRDDLLYAFNTRDGLDESPRNRMDWYLRRSNGTGFDNATLMASVPINWTQCQNYSLLIAQELQAGGSGSQPTDTAKFLGSSMLADVDGDGLADLVFRACDGKFWVALMKRTGTVGAPYVFTVVEAKFLSESGSPLTGDRCGYGTANLWRKEENFSQATDFDGDGRADLRFLIDARGCLGAPGDPDFRLDVFLSKGLSTDGTFVFQASRPFGAPPPISVGSEEGIAKAGQRIRTLDVNGDGLTDLVYRAADGKWRYRLGGPYAGARDAQVADALVAGGFQANPEYLQLLDFDGDGKLDLWNGDGTAYSVWLWRGDNWSSSAIVQTDYPKAASNQMPAIGDFDGDGSIDSFFAGLNGTKWNLRRSNAHHKPRGVITKIENGFGAVTQIDYGPLTFSSLYRRDYDAPYLRSGRGSAVFDVATPSYAVRSVSSSAPTFADANAKATVTYRYAGLKVQAGGRGSLGFRRVSSYDVQSKTEVDSYYTQRFPYTGSSYFTATRIFDPGSRLDADPCGSGVTATPDSPSCMRYVPPCTSGLNSTCDDDLPGISDERLIVKESSDTWQWRSAGKLGALAEKCVPGFMSGDAGSAAAETFDLDGTTAATCPGGWRMAQPDELDQIALASTAPAPIFLARIHSLTGNYDLGTGVTDDPNDLLSSESVDFAMADYDDYGNPRAGSTSKSDSTVSVSVASTFEYDNDVPNWRLGRLRTATAVTTRVTGTDSGSVRSSNARKSSFTYDARGMLASERVEGMKNGAVDASAPTVAKYYGYDTFGNRTNTFVCSTRISESVCRAQTTQGDGGFAFHPSVETDVMRHSSTEYDLSGRFADTTYELFQSASGAGGAKQLSSKVIARTPAGDPLEIQDFNGVQAKIRYGALGRKRFTWSQDGVSTRWEARFCSNVQVPAGTPTVACPPNMGLAYRSTTTKSGAPTSIAFHDILGRPVLTLTQGFASNTWSAAMVQYDAVGNVARKYDPFFAANTGTDAADPAGGAAPNRIWTETTYDALNRPTNIRHTGTGAATKIAYAGRQMVTTLPPNGVGGLGARQTITEIRNGLGEVVRTIDANGYEVVTQYDAAGNPEAIRRGSLATTMTYDTLGRKVGMSDPDAGSGWSYAVNGAGEVIRQTSPRGTCTKNDYDGRGRVWRRRDYGGACATLESTSTWVYDTVSAGQPTQESNGQLVRNFFYDGLGRLERAETVLDGKNYAEEWKFDEFGRPFQHFFEAPGQPKTGEQNRYEDGYLHEIRSAYPLRDGRILTYREIQTVNARGQVTMERAAPGLEYSTERRFDDYTGRLKEVLVGPPAGGVLQNVRYEYDLLGNVTSRIDGNGPYALTEEFGYDALQRLTSATVRQAGQTTYVRTQNYDVQGNILAKSDVGTPYRYGQREPACSGYGVPGPHAVSAAGSNTSLCYDANGNVAKRVTSQGTQTIAYTAADQVSEIRDGVNRVGFRYGPNRERVRRLDYAGSAAISADTVVHEVGGAQIRYTATSSDGAGVLQEVRRYVGNVLVVQSGSGATYALRRQVLLTDRQGSTHQVLGAMTLQPINPVGPASPMSFDAWGQRRDSTSWGAAVPWTQGLENLLKSSTTHGYTGHEMVESVGVIHMNGRIYDPQLARFLQADPFVQSPDNGQNWNRYSYTFNNPLAYTDPSGNLSVGDWARTVAAIAITYWTGGMAAGVIQTAGGLSAAVSSGAIWNAAAWSVAGGFAAGAVQSGSLKGAVAGAVSSGLFFSIGTSFSQGVGGDWMFQGGGLSFEGYAAKTLSHGMAGGVLETLQGGRFGHGFLSAGVSEALSPVIGRAQNPLAEGVIRSVVGGTASVAGGGKFANGAVTAAFSYAFGQVARKASESHAMDQRMAAAAYGDPQYWMAWQPPTLPQGLVDFAAGMGDAVSFGATSYIRSLYDIDGGVDEMSDAYRHGGYAGMANSLLMGGGAFTGAVTLGRTATVTRWGGEGVWYMVGGRSTSSWWLSGTRFMYPYESAVTTEIAAGRLSYPSGWQWIKGLVGQRVMGPGP